MNHTSTLLLLWLSCSYCAAQKITFDIFLWGNKIGQMTVVRESLPDGTTHYRLRSHTTAKVLWIKKEGISEYDAWFKNDKLLQSELRELENGVKKRFSSVQWDGHTYQIKNYKTNKTISQLPPDDVMGIFFSPQPMANSIFYQPEAELITIQKKDQHTWQFKSTDGQTNLYRYKNGSINELEFQLPLATVIMKRTLE